MLIFNIACLKSENLLLLRLSQAKQDYYMFYEKREKNNLTGIYNPTQLETSLLPKNWDTYSRSAKQKMATETKKETDEGEGGGRREGGRY